MATFDDLKELRRNLKRGRLFPKDLPPFALSPEQVHDLKSDIRMLYYRMPDGHPPGAGFDANKAVQFGAIDDSSIFTVLGLRCVRADRLGA